MRLFGFGKIRRGWHLEEIVPWGIYAPRLLSESIASGWAELVDLIEDAGVVRERTTLLRGLQAQARMVRRGVVLATARVEGLARPVVAAGLFRRRLEGHGARALVVLVSGGEEAALVEELRGRLARPEGLLSAQAEEGMAAYLAHLPPPEGVPLVDGVALGVEVTTRREALNRLMRLAVKTGALERPEEVAEAVRRQEAMAPSGLEGGFALPHCRTELAKRPVVVAASFRPGVAFGAADRSFAKVVCLGIAPIGGEALFEARVDGLFERLGGLGVTGAEELLRELAR